MDKKIMMPITSCPFCRIAMKVEETPGIFWENEEFVAFLSTKPNVKGFTVVIPKTHYRSDVLALPDDVLKSIVLAAKEVSNILLDYFEDVGRIGLIAEGTHVDHAHIKLIPMHGTDFMKKGSWTSYPTDKVAYSDRYKGYLTSIEGPDADEKVLRALAQGLNDTWKNRKGVIDQGVR